MPTRDGQVLQLAVAVGHADRADVVALGEEQLDDHPPILAQPLACRCWTFMSSATCGDAGRQQPAAAADLDQAEPAGADVGTPVEVAQRRDRDPRLAARPARIVWSPRALISLPSIVRVLTAAMITAFTVSDE